MASTGEYTLTLFQHAAQLVGYALFEALKKLSTKNDNLLDGVHKTQGESLIDIPLLALIHNRPEFKTTMAEWMTSSVVFKRSIHKLLAYIRSNPNLVSARAFYISQPPSTEGDGNTALLDDFCGSFDELYKDRVRSPYFAALFPENDTKLSEILRFPILASLTDPPMASVNARKAIFAAVHGLLVAKFVFDIIPEYHGIIPSDFDASKGTIVLGELVSDTEAHILTLIGVNLVSEYLPVKAMAPSNRGDEESDLSGGAAAVRSISQDPNRQDVTPVNITAASVSVNQLDANSLKPFRKSPESSTKLQSFLHLFRQRPMSDKDPLQYYQLQLIIGIAQYKNQFNPMKVSDLSAYIDKTVPEGDRNPISILKRSKNIVVIIQNATHETNEVMMQMASPNVPLSELFTAIPKQDETDDGYKAAKEVLTGKVDWTLLKSLSEKDLLDLSADKDEYDAAMTVVNSSGLTWVDMKEALDQVVTMTAQVKDLQRKLREATKK